MEITSTLLVSLNLVYFAFSYIEKDMSLTNQLCEVSQNLIFIFFLRFLFRFFFYLIS